MATPRPIPAKAFSTKPLPLLATLLSRFLRVLLRTTQPFTLCIRFCCWHPGLHWEEWLVPQQVQVNPQLPKSPWYLGSCLKSVWVGWERCSNPEPAVGVGSPSEGRGGHLEAEAAAEGAGVGGAGVAPALSCLHSLLWLRRVGGFPAGQA